MSKILVIDDESWLREMIRLALEQRGFEVIEAMDSTEGVTQAREQLPDLILCDVNMDKAGSGYTTLAKLRENPGTAAIPFILMTGLADAAGMRHGMDLGADDYLPKPFKVDELYATVQARLRKVQTVRQEAEKKLTLLRSQISLMLPHEMRTPLNGIISNAELLAESASSLDPQTIAEMSQDICHSGQRLERLIENFLIYAQLEIVASDPQSVSRLRSASTVRPGEIARAAAIAEAQKVGREADIDLEFEECSLPMAEDYFRKIVVELVQNALKFSDSGLRVRVRLKATPEDVIFSVQDDGRGFSSEQISRVGAYMQFERRMQDEQGFGLGLAIAKKLVELHGGALSIESEAGIGSTVTVKLPLATVAGS
ncbi:MAG TPA: ATP-binding protein [Candidatus Acidoferrales bacterium]|nr:ATP-binding protein [Candidatus Acidoferrales bacterium]